MSDKAIMLDEIIFTIEQWKEKWSCPGQYLPVGLLFTIGDVSEVLSVFLGGPVLRPS